MGHFRRRCAGKRTPTRCLHGLGSLSGVVRTEDLEGLLAEVAKKADVEAVPTRAEICTLKDALGEKASVEELENSRANWARRMSSEATSTRAELSSITLALAEKAEVE